MRRDLSLDPCLCLNNLKLRSKRMNKSIHQQVLFDHYILGMPRHDTKQGQDPATRQ